VRSARAKEIEWLALVATVLPPTQLTGTRTRHGHRVGSTTRTTLPSRSTTTRTMHQRSDSAPSDAVIVTLLNGVAAPTIDPAGVDAAL